VALPTQTLSLEHSGSAPWTRFDAEWYQRRYAPDMGAIAPTPSALMAHYLEIGRRLSYSPNPLFDEAWYLKAHPEAAQEVRSRHLQSGFEHYCIEGYRHVSPHWLFDQVYYRERYADLAPELLDRLGLVNYYAHFLRYGTQEGRIAHRFFWPKFYWAALEPAQREEAATKGAFQHFLATSVGEGPESRTTPYFAPTWYRDTYGDIDAAIRDGQFSSALHHYLTNEMPAAFDPNPIFSEAAYLRRNDDVAAAVNEQRVRSGYHHFIADGVKEHRFFSRAIDLHKYVASHALVRADLKADPAMDAYLHFLTIGTALGLAVSPQAALVVGPEEDHSKAQFRSEAEVVALSHARCGIDFTMMTPPVVSVIMVVHNRFSLTKSSLASLRSNFHEAIELILVDSGSTDETINIETMIKGAKLIRLATNEGFVVACNTALRHVTSDTVLFLNNDIRLSPRAVEAALLKLRSANDIGAVGGKIVRAHGRLQEAGCVIWRDGGAAGCLRDGDPLDPRANYARDVDYCSAVFLLVPAALVKALGGFDSDYAPSYYEDTDLCVRIGQVGFRVIYDPAVVVHHLEYGSLEASEDAEAAMERGRRIFVRKHADWLMQQPERLYGGGAARARVTGRGRILFIDDTIPVRAMGSGFVRANDIIGEMAALGYAVTVFPINPTGLPILSIYPDFPDTVEILHSQTIDGLQTYIDEDPRRFHVIWVSRTHNLRLVKQTIKDLRTPEGRPVRIVIDTEAITSARERAKLRVRPQATGVLSQSLTAEFRHVEPGNHVICVNEAERAILQGQRLTKVSVLGHFRHIDATPKTFESRRGLLLLGAIHEVDTPNHDALYWFVESVLPLIVQELGGDISVTVVGYQGEGVDLSNLADRSQINLLGYVANTRHLYNDHRVFVAPTRFAAGIPYKIHEAASYGLPIVTTSLIASQIGWGHGTELLAADERNPVAFAQQVVTLYRSVALWQSLRLYATRRLLQENNQHDYRQAIASILVGEVSAEAEGSVASVAAPSSFRKGAELPPALIA
jgi:O-antigen biosynthesis protein